MELQELSKEYQERVCIFEFGYVTFFFLSKYKLF